MDADGEGGWGLQRTRSALQPSESQIDDLLKFDHQFDDTFSQLSTINASIMAVSHDEHRPSPTTTTNKHDEEGLAS